MYEKTIAMKELDVDNLPIMLTIADHVAPILGISDKHGRDLAREGQLDGAVRVGRVWRVPRDKFLAQFGLV